MDVEEQLDLISLAWGKQDGYCFFPTIRGDAKNKEERIRSYSEGPAFHWPHEREQILNYLREHKDDDVYWCPNLFESKKRRMDQAMDEHALWADLDEVDPRTIDEEYRPTIAWQTSPGRFQALWLIQRGFDIQGASWAGGENQRLTYYLNADVSGWDSTQLLRIPGWKNHKPEYRTSKGAPTGKLLWHDRHRRYLPDHFEDLPEVDAATAGMRDVLDEEIERVDRHAVWARVRLKVNRTVREYMGAKDVTGDRSEVLWQIERELADAGCTVVEIVALVRPTPWNKYAGRGDELRRLTNEAAKAVAARPEEVAEQLEAEANRPKPVRFGELLTNIPKPVWLVEGIWTKGACGFIAGQPKSFKSWCGLDLGLSVATGMDFLGHFPVRIPGPVLYIQEEDGLPILKQRTDKIWPGKQIDRMVMKNGELVWEPPSDMGDLTEAPIDAYVGQGFTLSDPSWQGWLDEVIEETGYVMVILDPFMMMAGDVEENRAQEMTTKVFRPLKQIAQKHNVSICLVHHMKKANNDGHTRGGQLMLGSVANHAWAEDSLYLRLNRGDLYVERESKHTTSGKFKLGHIRTKDWTPVVMDEQGDLDTHPDDEVRTAAKQKPTSGSGSSSGNGTGGRQGKALQALKDLGPGVHTQRAVAEAAGITPEGARRQLMRAANAVQVGQGKWVYDGK